MRRFLKKNFFEHHKKISFFVVLCGGMVVGAIARGAAIPVPAQTTVPGELPPPPMTTPASTNLGTNCDQTQQKNAIQNIKAGQAGYNGLQGPLQLAATQAQTCLSSLANMSIPGLTGFNMSGLLASLENSACQISLGMIQQQISPVYSAVGQYSPQALVSQATGTIGASGGQIGQVAAQGINSGVTGPTTTYTAGSVLNSAGSAATSIFK